MLKGKEEKEERRKKKYSSLQKNGYLERIGSKRNGKWIVLK
ncbi:MAG: hypothetical protein ACOX1A_07040 [Saccharofermentanales bacterium]